MLFSPTALFFFLLTIGIICIFNNNNNKVFAQEPEELMQSDRSERNKQYHKFRKLVEEADKRRSDNNKKSSNTKKNNKNKNVNNNNRDWVDFDTSGDQPSDDIDPPSNLAMSGESEEEVQQRNEFERRSRNNRRHGNEKNNKKKNPFIGEDDPSLYDPEFGDGGLGAANAGDANSAEGAAAGGGPVDYSRKGAEGLDANLIAPFQQPQQVLDTERLTFYTPIEVSVYKTRVQCGACRSMFAILDDRQREKFEHHYHDDHISKTVEDIFERVEQEGCEAIEWFNDEDVARLCKSSSEHYDGLCAKDLKGGCEVLRKHLLADKNKKRGSHERVSTLNLCSEIGMCKRMF